MDIDLDLKTDFDPLEIFPEAVRASMIKNDDLVKHNVGVFFQSIPVDKMTGLAAIPYEQAEEVGYFKIDFLHLSLLDSFESKDEIRELLKHDPDWSLLMRPDVVGKLFQIHRQYDLVSKLAPKSVIELADCIALMRPGKRHLVDAYLKDKDLIRTELYKKPEDGKYYFKKGHAISYALNIVLQLHLIKGGVL
jgi:DNA polymerase III alpha subunit